MSTAVHLSIGLYPVADDVVIAVSAPWGEGVNGAFKAVKVMGASLCHDLHRLVIIVPADFTFQTPESGRSQHVGANPSRSEPPPRLRLAQVNETILPVPGDPLGAPPAHRVGGGRASSAGLRPGHVAPRALQSPSVAG